MRTIPPLLCLVMLASFPWLGNGTGSPRKRTLPDIYNEEKNAAAARAQRDIAYGYEKGRNDLPANQVEVHRHRIGAKK